MSHLLHLRWLILFWMNSLLGTVLQFFPLPMHQHQTIDMSCKNCLKDISEDSSFCKHCGAEVIKTRITAREIISQISNSIFGWDNRFFRTLRYLIFQPGTLLQEYLGGVRKKFVNPFSFLAFCTSISLIVFNLYSAQFFGQADFAESLTKEIEARTNTVEVPPTEIDPIKKQEEDEKRAATEEWVLKYYLIFSFLFLPVYALISMGVYPKRYNFGEHLTINAFIQGLLSLEMMILFVISLLTSPAIYFFSILMTFVYYPYAYSSLFQHTPKQAFLAILRFFLIALVVSVLIIVSGYLFGNLSG